MKKSLLLSLLLAGSALAEGLVGLTNDSPRLQWDYPTNYVTSILSALPNVTNAISRQQLTNIWYFSYWSTNIANTNAWNLFNITNNPVIISTPEGRWVHEVPIPKPLLPSCYFITGVSNYVGLTFFSGMAATPPLLPASQQNYHLQ